MHVEGLWRYPVKSMIGEEVDRVDLDRRGVVGDRTWAARDLERGGIRGAKKIGGLMRLAAADRGRGVVEITLPDGRTVQTDDPDVDRQVSGAVGHAVRLEPLAAPEDLEHYRRGGPDSDDLMVELRSIFGRTPDEPLPDLSVFPPEILEFESPPGTYHDAFPLLLLSTSALASLADALADSVVDVRRFRPSVVVDTAGLAGHPEFDWVGRRLTIGEAEVEVTTPCPRCVMVTREIDEATPADRAILRHVVADLDQNVGVYATVVTPGAVALGDSVSVR